MKQPTHNNPPASAGLRKDRTMHTTSTTDTTTSTNAAADPWRSAVEEEETPRRPWTAVEQEQALARWRAGGPHASDAQWDAMTPQEREWCSRGD